MSYLYFGPVVGWGCKVQLRPHQYVQFHFRGDSEFRYYSMSYLSQSLVEREENKVCCILRSYRYYMFHSKGKYKYGFMTYLYFGLVGWWGCKMQLRPLEWFSVYYKVISRCSSLSYPGLTLLVRWEIHIYIISIFIYIYRDIDIYSRIYIYICICICIWGRQQGGVAKVQLRSRQCVSVYYRVLSRC